MNSSAQPIAAFDWKFLRRTAVVIVAVALAVGVGASVVYDAGWGFRYLTFAAWALVFFSLTALILKSLAFDQDRSRGMLFVFGKVVWLGALFAVPIVWPMEGPNLRPHAIAMFAGITTPLAVVVFRAVGFMMEAQRKGMRIVPPGATPIDAKPSDTSLPSDDAKAQS